ncbi:hypothetical protein EB001_11075 [bacterium]|nr:hypothetical protein [bacterium]
MKNKKKIQLYPDGGSLPLKNNTSDTSKISPVLNIPSNYKDPKLDGYMYGFVSPENMKYSGIGGAFNIPVNNKLSLGLNSEILPGAMQENTYGVNASYKFGLGGFFNDAAQTGLNALKFVGNNAVQTVGGNRPFDYTGANRQSFDKLDNVASPIYGAASAALPMAANMVVPGSGAVVSMAQQGIGAATDGLQVRAEGGYVQHPVNLNAFVAGAPLLSNFPKHAEGGQMQNPNAMLTNFPTGGTHEENPMGGVNVGNRGLVEEGETKAPLDKGDYIFSDRLKPKGSSRTFAQISKSIHNKYKDRENDAAATRSMKADLERLSQEQEALKQAKQAKMQGSMDALSNIGEGDMFMHGGKLKPYSKFMLPQYDGNKTKTNFLQSTFGPVNTDNDPNEVAFNQEFPGESYNTFNPLTGASTPQVSESQTPMYSQSDALGLTKKVTPSYGNQNQNANYVDPFRGVHNVNDVIHPETKPEGYTFNTKTDPWIPLAQSAGDIFALTKSLKPQKDIKLPRYTPEMLDYSRERQAATNQSAMANQIAQANIRRNASSSGQALSNTVANNAVNNAALMQQLSQSYQGQENANKQLSNNAIMANNATSNQEQELNMKNKAQLAFMQQQALTNIGANTANFGVDQKKDKAQDKYNQMVMGMANNPDYKLMPDGKGGFTWLYVGKTKQEGEKTKQVGFSKGFSTL